MAAGLFAHMAAGAAESVGKSMAEQAKEMRDRAREDRIWEREAAFRQQENASERQFRTQERMDEQGWRSREAAIAREDSNAEAARARDATGAAVTMEDGSTGYQVGDTVRPMKGADGKAVKLATKATDDPADVATMRFMVEKGIAEDYDEAWDKMNRKVASATATPADIEKMVEDAVKTEFAGNMADPTKEEIEESRARNRARILEHLTVSTESDKSKPAAGVMPKPDSVAKQTAPSDTMPREPAAKTGARPKVSREAQAAGRPQGVSDETLIADAQRVLKGGADPDAVRARLRSTGIDPAKAGL